MSSRCDARRTTHRIRNCSTRPAENRPWDIMATQRGICKKEISATLQTVSALVCLSLHRVPLVFISNRRPITSPSIGVLKFREQPRIEGIPILNKWSNKLNLFIHFSSPINYFENRKSMLKHSILNQKKKN